MSEKVIKDKNIKVSFLENENEDSITVEIMYNIFIDIPKNFFNDNFDKKDTIKKISSEINDLIEEYIEELEKSLEE